MILQPLRKAPLAASIFALAAASPCASPAPSPSPVPTPTPTPAPRPAAAQAPRLDPLTAEETAPMLAEPRHCTASRDGRTLLAAAETTRLGRVKADGRILRLTYEERSPLRNGGRFKASRDILDVWIAVDPAEDRRLPRGEPRHVTIMANGLTGGSAVASAIWACNY